MSEGSGDSSGDGSTSSGDSSSGNKPVYSTRFKIVGTLVAVVAVGLLVVAYQKATDAGDDPILESGGTREFVEALIPANDSQVPQQTTVGIDLAAGWQGTLALDGEEVPPDQLQMDEALNRVQFTPGPGRILEALPPGSVCVQARVWRAASGREAGERTVSWCFDVV